MENQLRFFQQDFIVWLETLNYSSETIRHAKRSTIYFVKYHASKSIETIHELSAMSVHEFFNFIKLKPNERLGGGISVAYFNKLLGDIKLFKRFLQEKYGITITLQEKRLKGVKTEIEVLSLEAIRALYDACDDDLKGCRDKAILSLYYGAGLRRSEGTNLLLENVNLDARTVHVKASKNRKERLVPIPVKVMHDLKEYVLIARPGLKSIKSRVFLLNDAGRPMQGLSANNKLKRLTELSQNEELYIKAVTLHVLRHSYATHLLEAGMDITKISRLLGHRSLVSTQVYTHITPKNYTDGI
jgi:integrase/recombinase XerD